MGTVLESSGSSELRSCTFRQCTSQAMSAAATIKHGSVDDHLHPTSSASGTAIAATSPWPSPYALTEAAMIFGIWGPPSRLTTTGNKTLPIVMAIPTTAVIMRKPLPPIHGLTRIAAPNRTSARQMLRLTPTRRATTATKGEITAKAISGTDVTKPATAGLKSKSADIRDSSGGIPTIGPRSVSPIRTTATIRLT